MASDILALLDSDPVAGLWEAIRQIEAEASRVSLGSSGRFDVEDPEKGEWLVDFLLAVGRGWRGVVERHTGEERQLWAYGGLGGMQSAGQAVCCEYCPGDTRWPCPELTETADEVRAYLGGAS
jgi:hypothetical protein